VIGPADVAVGLPAHLDGGAIGLVALLVLYVSAALAASSWLGRR
jgi:hypothetical protein